MNKNKGFTLIELLVVIAIIGILSSVVLASLSSARNKGKDAAVKSQLASMKAQAEIFYSAGNTYLGLCASTTGGFGGTGGPGLLLATKDAEGVATTIQVAAADVGGTDHVTCHDAVDTWVVDAPLVADATTGAMFCVDSSGVSKVETTGMLTGVTACVN